jgi:pipecolate-incorporating enzyme
MLRAMISARLPAYMVPRTFVPIEALPMALGKVDRKALAAIPIAGMTFASDYVPPATPDQAAIVRDWEDVLGASSVGIDDDFFDLGGDSVRAMRVLSRIDRWSSVRLAVSTLFQSPTPRLLGVALAAARSQAAARRPDTSEPMHV